MYTLQSSIDNKKFNVDANVMKASTLLKNLSEMTSITEPVKVECSSESLEYFIQIIEKQDDSFLSDLSDQKLAEICKDLSILDSDEVFNSIAKSILSRIRKQNFKEMMKYFGVEDDFSTYERKLINDWSRVEYLISMDTDQMKFPFSGKTTNFSSMKNKFYTPLNALLARVIQLSHGKTAFELSKINKAMKNESDRYPIKVHCFSVSEKWWLDISANKFRITDKKYFDHIKKRKLDVKRKIGLLSSETIQNLGGVKECESFNFVIPTISTPPIIAFQFKTDGIDCFNVKECPFPVIHYKFMAISVDFDKIYEHLVAKDITKKIEIISSHAFQLFGRFEYVWIYKEPNDSKFHEIRINASITQENTNSSKFVDFVKKYMCDDGVIYSSENILDIQHSFNYDNEFRYKHTYLVSDVKKMF